MGLALLASERPRGVCSDTAVPLPYACSFSVVLVAPLRVPRLAREAHLSPNMTYPLRPSVSALLEGRGGT